MFFHGTSWKYSIVIVTCFFNKLCCRGRTATSLASSGTIEHGWRLHREATNIYLLFSSFMHDEPTQGVLRRTKSTAVPATLRSSEMKVSPSMDSIVKIKFMKMSSSSMQHRLTSCLSRRLPSLSHTRDSSLWGASYCGLV